MENTQDSDKNMCDRIITTIENAPAATMALIPNFGPYYTQFKAKVIDIDTQWNFQIRDNKGYSERKDLYRTQVSASGLDLATKVASLAKATGDMVLFNEMNFTESDFSRATDGEVANMATLISATVEANMVGLVVYHVTVPILTDFNDILALYIDSKPQPRMKIEEKAYSTKMIKEDFVAAKVLLKNMDREIKTLPVAERAFIDNYFLNRKIVDPARRTLIIKGHVVDQDGHPLQVNISCPTLGLDRKTSKKGGFSMKNGGEGEHFITSNRPGFTTVVTSVNVFGGTRTNVLIVMQLHAIPEPV